MSECFLLGGPAAYNKRHSGRHSGCTAQSKHLQRRDAVQKISGSCCARFDGCSS